MTTTIVEAICEMHRLRPGNCNLLLVVENHIMPVTDLFSTLKVAKAAARGFSGKLQAYAVHTPTAMHLFDGKDEEVEWGSFGS
jgi:hypothetical protein